MLPLVSADTLPAATLLRPSTAAHLHQLPTGRRPRAAAGLATATRAPRKLLRVLAAGGATSAPARQQPLPAGEPVRNRSRGIALLLAVVPLLFGLPLGLYHFYLGYTGRGLGSLGLGLLAFVLVTIGFVGSFGLLFGGTSGGLFTLFVIGAVIFYALIIQQLVDAVRIILGDLKPQNGEYYPRFFQTRPAADAAPPSH
ncbi:hypothetical protein HHL22_13550 [Hymenobacter sp. RP-2-7]|uniref:TM2 domain-containing protein n=1 Tax=Hymenobacter polaris TaxID=2682546 RepID=A0A7Y0AF90_9BACT|nr:hypothetical protein [Hymenobacter polaris]NML66232.1 hypothetical protein [Hymenobacter polaris]